MAPGKIYASADSYEKKLGRVMERFGIAKGDYDWNADRHGAHVWFRYKGEVYRFEYTVAQAKAKGEKLQYGSDAFARVVLTLEDLARMIEHGIYDLQTWVKGMRYLPPPIQYPVWVGVLGLEAYPKTAEEVTAQYRLQAKVVHPDAGGSQEEFVALNQAKDEAMAWLKERHE